MQPLVADIARRIAIDYYKDGEDHKACQHLHQPLYDVLHSLFKEDYGQDPLLFQVLMYCTVAMYLVVYYESDGRSYPLHRQSYALAAWGVLLVLKTCTTILTIVPSPLGGTGSFSLCWDCVSVLVRGSLTRETG